MPGATRCLSHMYNKPGKNIIMRVGAPLVGALYNNEKNNKKIDRINIITNSNNRAPIKGAPTLCVEFTGPIAGLRLRKGRLQYLT